MPVYPPLGFKPLLKESSSKCTAALASLSDLLFSRTENDTLKLFSLLLK